MGPYKKIEERNAGKPVWQSMVRDDRYLFYNGKDAYHIMSV